VIVAMAMKTNETLFKKFSMCFSIGFLGLVLLVEDRKWRVLISMHC